MLAHLVVKPFALKEVLFLIVILSEMKPIRNPMTHKSGETPKNNPKDQPHLVPKLTLRKLNVMSQ